MADGDRQAGRQAGREMVDTALAVLYELVTKRKVYLMYNTMNLCVCVCVRGKGGITIHH
jgi:hypothetical protein